MSEFVCDAPHVPAWNDDVIRAYLPELYHRWIPGLVVAGGALVSWAFPNGTPDPTSDIDLWTCDRSVFLATVKRFEGRKLLFAPYTVKVVRGENQLPVQIMYHPRVTIQGVVADFDLDAVRAFYNGENRWLHRSCVESWERRAVLSSNKDPVPQYRLDKMLRKGFQILLPRHVQIDPEATKREHVPVRSDHPLHQAELVADLVDSLPSEDVWTHYHMNRALRPARDFTFDTEVKHVGPVINNKRSLGLSVVPEPLAELLEPLTSVLYFLKTELPPKELGPARLTVRVFGALTLGRDVYPVTRVVAWETKMNVEP